MSRILDLASADEPRVEECGGKWLGLWRLARLGARVPEAFCIGASAHRSLRAAGAGAPRTAAPEPLLRGICAAYAGLGRDVPVAVRSSATAEDLADASFAGQYDTFLDVRGAEALLDAVRRCWASVDNDRAVAYRERAGIPHDGVAMAVVVQRMVPAEVAGVAFTRHPTEDRDVMLVEACRGLGEALVSGAVDPDRFELSRADDRVAVFPAGPAACLDPSQLRSLRDRFLALETGLGFDADLEWALYGGELHLLQARPITARAMGSSAGAPAAAGDLRGVAASPGSATGRARVLLDPDVAELDPGDILVTEQTDPSWTRHFTVAGGLVMERGGMLSHGAIVARECEIPAVVGVEGATARIADGATIRVDGSSGSVTFVSGE